MKSSLVYDLHTLIPTLFMHALLMNYYSFVSKKLISCYCTVFYLFAWLRPRGRKSAKSVSLLFYYVMLLTKAGPWPFKQQAKKYTHTHPRKPVFVKIPCNLCDSSRFSHCNFGFSTVKKHDNKQTFKKWQNTSAPRTLTHDHQFCRPPANKIQFP